MATDIAKLVLKVDSKEAKTAQKELDRLAKSGQKAEKATDGMTGGFNKASFAVTKLSGALSALSIGLALKEIIQTGAEFQKTISNLSAITGATGEELQFMADSAKELGAATTLSASQVATAFKLIASAKPDLLESAEALKAVTKEAITLAEAAVIDVADAAAVLGTSLNQFGEGAEEANRFINVLAAGAKFGASEITATATALEKVGVVAKSTGLTFEETNAAIQLLAESGTKAEIAGTGLKTILLRLSTQADSTINPSIVGMAQAFQNLKDQSLSATEQKNLFGLEALAVAQILTTGAEKLETLTGKLTDTNTATEQASRNVDNLSGDWEKLKSVTEATAISLEEKLDPALRAIVQTMTEAVGVSAGFTAEMLKIANLSFENPSAVLVEDAKNLKVTADDLKEVADTFGKVTFDPITLEGIPLKSIERIEKVVGVMKEIEEVTKTSASAFARVWTGTIDTFSQGIGDAFADAALKGENFTESWSKLQDALRHQILSSLVEIGVKESIFWAAEKAAALDLFATKKTLAAADIALTASTSATTAAIVTAEMGAITTAAIPAATATSVATGGANVGLAVAAMVAGLALVKSEFGQAHAGLTESQSDQTILISKGEAVIQPEQNKDLRAFLKKQSDNGGSRPTTVNLNLTVPDTQSGVEFINSNRAAISNIIARATQARGGR